MCKEGGAVEEAHAWSCVQGGSAGLPLTVEQAEEGRAQQQPQCRHAHGGWACLAAQSGSSNADAAGEEGICVYTGHPKVQHSLTNKSSTKKKKRPCLPRKMPLFLATSSPS